ncbi:2-phospho-L-lactate guanylyltransferase [Natrarchaeobaculum aegyptiacum]|uniref:2-phospho-L-lactate guanylyltransferase n=1 Tax=Natrarchaeobaculum aegyptiacum TaxID=745377 RepID=A0A2Z2HYD1_9EURY|nr:2-phospho-L-lactate guanylyltransferase [Natrarchaeobaculum aegyptiacum]ARS91355.1 2-phospho-L-lactate guanylyltransferase [Natrarchaeobaculum aegyptiacum]
MEVLVPFAAERPKTRLEPVLSAEERAAFARVMLADVLETVTETGHDPVVLSTAPLEDRAVESERLSREPEVDPRGTIEGIDPQIVIDDRSLSAAVGGRLPGPGDDPVAVVMADLALVTPVSLETLFEPLVGDGPRGESVPDVVIAPGRGGGTNALVVDHPQFSVDYHGASYRDHVRIAREAGATVESVDSYRLGTDVDEPADLVEVVLHGEGQAAAFLDALGFDLETGSGRVTVARDSGPI